MIYIEFGCSSTLVGLVGFLFLRVHLSTHYKTELFNLLGRNATTSSSSSRNMSCKDCEEIPPVSAEYAEKGRHETIAGWKTCKSSPSCYFVFYLGTYAFITNNNPLHMDYLQTSRAQQTPHAP